MGRFEGKVALVTGGASGMGSECVRNFAREGANVLIADLSEEAGEALASEIRNNGGSALFRRTDVTREDDVQALVDAALDRFGRLDCAANMAGVSQVGGLYCSSDARERTLAVNLTGTINAVRAEVQAMRQGGGAIVNCASIAGISGAADAPYYVAAKHGVVGFTKSVALEFAAANIRVNVICPGFTRTAMSEGYYGSDVDAIAARYTPMRRIGLAREQADAACWLCSDEASFVTGAVLSVDGGYAAGISTYFEDS